MTQQITALTSLSLTAGDVVALRAPNHNYKTGALLQTLKELLDGKAVQRGDGIPTLCLYSPENRPEDLFRSLLSMIAADDWYEKLSNGEVINVVTDRFYEAGYELRIMHYASGEKLDTLITHNTLLSALGHDVQVMLVDQVSMYNDQDQTLEYLCEHAQYQDTAVLVSFDAPPSALTYNDQCVGDVDAIMEKLGGLKRGVPDRVKHTYTQFFTYVDGVVMLNRVSAEKGHQQFRFDYTKAIAA